MALFENNLSDLVVRLLCVPLQAYQGGSCTTAVSTLSFKDVNQIQEDDYFQNTTPVSRVRIISTTDGATPIGKESLISDFVNSDGAFVFAPAITTVEVGDGYIVLSEYRWDELVEAINTAIDIATANRVLIEKIDETIAVQTDTYEYNIPTGFTHIYRISQENDDGDYPDPIPPSHYKILRGKTIPQIHFYRFPVAQMHSDHWFGGLWADADINDGRHLRIEGFARQSKLLSEQDVCYIDPNFIVYQAASLLHGARIVQPASDYDNNRIKAEYCEAKAREFLSDARIQLPPDCKKVMR